MDLTASNPRAASARIEPQRPGEYKGQRAHDLRRGPQPAYVDSTRSHLNRVLIEPPTPGAMTKICQVRRALRETRRAMKAGTTCAYIGVITFGTEAQPLFSRLTPQQQDAAYLEAAEAIADRMGTTLEGLVIHADESAPHAHLSFPAYDRDGQPLTKSMKKGALVEIQDILADVMGRHAPGIERGRSRAARIEAGADPAAIIHRSVRQLHLDLPAEIAAKKADLAEASARVDEMRARVEKLEAKATLTDKEAKRLETYQARLSARIAEQEAAQAEAERLAALARDEAAQAVLVRDQAKADGDAARTEAAEAEARRTQADEDARRAAEKAGALLTATVALTAEITAGTLQRTDEGRIRVKDRQAIQAGLPDLTPALNAAVDAAEARRREERAAEAAKAARAAEEAKAEATKAEAARLLDEAKQDRAEAATLWQEVERLRAKVAKGLRLINGWLKSPNLTQKARQEGTVLHKVITEDADLTPPTKEALPPTEKPPGGSDDFGL